MTQISNETLPFLSSQERLEAYKLIADGCHHIWSKNEMQRDKAQQALDSLIPLTKNDPYVSFLSSADGTPFSEGSEYKKPNLRYIGAAALQKLDPKLADRVLKLSNTKYAVSGYLNNASHSPSTLRTALRKYLKYREAHPEYVTGIKKAGLGRVLKRIYNAMRQKPNEEVVKILRWKRDDIKVDFGAREYDFTGLKDLAIAQTIREQKIPYLGVLGELSRVGKKVSPVIAVAMLEQATGNQAVIMRATFEDAGILNDPEVMKLYTDKIRSAKTTLDRVETISENASQAVKDAMVQARAESRQAQTAGIGKIYMHLDDSGSMQGVREFAQDRQTE